MKSPDRRIICFTKFCGLKTELLVMQQQALVPPSASYCFKNINTVSICLILFFKDYLIIYMYVCVYILYNNQLTTGMLTSCFRLKIWTDVAISTYKPCFSISVTDGYSTVCRIHLLLMRMIVFHFPSLHTRLNSVYYIVVSVLGYD